MATYRVVVTDQVFPDVELERKLLGEIGAELIVPGPDVEAMFREAEEADALLNTYLPLGRPELGRLRRARIVARYGIGVDNIDLDAARERGIVVTNVPDYCVEEVAAHTLTLLLAWVRRLPASTAKAQSGTWNLDGLRPIPRVSGLTVGVVGLGRIGRRMIDLLRPFGLRIVGHDPYSTGAVDGVERLGSLPELLAVADIVTLHLPVTAETRGMIGADELAAMRPGALLVNTSRGALVRTPDLVAALAAGRIGGAALDVLEKEAADAAALAGFSNVLLTPHTAYYSEEALRESQRKAVTQVIQVLTGGAPDYAVT